MADHFKRALLLRGGILFQERITSVNTGAPRESSRVPETLGIPINEPSKSEKRKEMGREGREGWEGRGEVGRNLSPSWNSNSRPAQSRGGFETAAWIISPGRGWNKGMRCDMQTNVSIIQRGEPGRAADFIRFLKITPDYRPSNVSSRRIRDPILKKKNRRLFA